MGLLGLIIYLLTIIWIVVTCAGLAMLALGLRGRVADKHLRCRRCRHVYISGGSDPSICTECGGDLRKPGSLRIGRRRMNETQIVFSVMMLGASTAAVLGVMRHKRLPNVVPATPAAAVNKVVKAVARPQYTATDTNWFSTNNVYYADSSLKDNPGIVHRNATIEGYGAVKEQPILQQLGNLPYGVTTAAVPSAISSDDSALAALPNNSDDSRQRTAPCAALPEILPDPFSEWSSIPTDWLTFRLATAGRGRDSGSAAMEFDGSLRSLQTDASWQAPPSNIAQGWMQETAGVASQMRVKPQSTAIKPARTGSAAPGTVRAPGGRSRGN